MHVRILRVLRKHTPKHTNLGLRTHNTNGYRPSARGITDTDIWLEGSKLMCFPVSQVYLFVEVGAKD